MDSFSSTDQPYTHTTESAGLVVTMVIDGRGHDHSNDGHRCSCFLLAVGCWLLAVGCWVLVVGCWLVVGGCRLLVGGWWLLVVGWWLVVGGWWLVVGGWWLVVVGCWLLVVGCWSLVVGCWLCLLFRKYALAHNMLLGYCVFTPPPPTHPPTHPPLGNLPTLRNNILQAGHAIHECCASVHCKPREQLCRRPGTSQATSHPI